MSDRRTDRKTDKTNPSTGIAVQSSQKRNPTNSILGSQKVNLDPQMKLNPPSVNLTL